MKAKLHKMVSGYILSLNGDIDDPYAIVNEELAKDHEWYRLSLKNCQAIERGYDLDELAYEKSWNEDSEKGFINGANTVLYLMGDKKFSEDDLLQAVEMYYGEGKTFIEVIQSLQQKEWDVEIRMEEIHFGGGCYKKQPKLDADGCLILKGISK